jgi:DNA polymerase III sliding clamp (beta) subunit (PCNA family)
MDVRIKDVDLLIKTLTPISKVIYEGIFKFDANGMSFCWADGSNSLVVDLKIDKSAFKEYNVEKEELVSINIDEFMKYLNRLTGTVRLSTEKAGMLKMKSYEPEKEFEIRMIDLKAQEIPSYKGLQFTTEVELDYDTFTTVLDDTAIVSESILIKILPEGIRIESGQGFNKYTFEISKGNEKLKSYTTTTTGKVIFGYDYLKRMFSAKIADTIKLKLKNDFPMIAEIKAEGINLLWILAPRIGDEE